MFNTNHLANGIGFRHRLLMSILLILSSPVGLANEITLLKGADGIEVPLSSNPRLFTNMGDAAFFHAYTAEHGSELWRTDGTSDGTRLVKDIHPTGDSEPGNFTAVGDTLFFRADDGMNGTELWRSDGTLEGTQLVKDINKGSVRSFSGQLVQAGSLPNRFADAGGVLLFFAHDGEHGYELWRSDGSEPGTYMVMDINPGANDSARLHESRPPFAVLDGVLYFEADDGVHGSELWRSDGTQGGTYLVRDISPGAAEAAPDRFIALGEAVYFYASDGEHGRELWRTDGTQAGTYLVKDISPGIGSSSFSNGRYVKTGNYLPSYVTAYNNYYPIIIYKQALYFQANSQLWRSDGSAAGTFEVSERKSSPFAFVVYNDTLFFIASNRTDYGYELWRSDGSPEGTLLVKDINPGSASAFSPNDAFGYSELFSGPDGIYFIAEDGSSDCNGLWRSDGTADGTHLIIQVCPDSRYTYSSMTYINDTLLLNLFGEGGNELWRTDGTSQGTQLVKDINKGDRINGGVKFLGKVDANRALFTSYADNGELALWRTDGTTEGTSVIDTLTGLVGGAITSGITSFSSAVISNTLYFGYGDPQGPEDRAFLCQTDGTKGGSYSIAEFNNVPGGFVERDDLIYFFASTKEYGYELWLSDGSSAGTHVVKNIGPDAADGVNANYRETTFGYYYTSKRVIAATADKVFISANDSQVGYELWATDGTEEATFLIRDIRRGSEGSNPDDFFAVNGVLYFSADDGIHGRELWRSDGTIQGTYLLVDINEGSGSSNPKEFLEFDGRVYFSANDIIHGTELWQTDGTTEGTTLVMDVDPTFNEDTPNGSYTGEMFVFKGHLYFSAATNSGHELWRSDGTSEGTVLFKDINKGPYSANPGQPTIIDDLLFFAADDGVHGYEAWISDGTLSGTRMLYDVDAGFKASFPKSFTRVGSKYIFTASSQESGNGLWALDVTSNDIGQQTTQVVTEDSKSGGAGVFFWPIGLAVLFLVWRRVSGSFCRNAA